MALTKRQQYTQSGPVNELLSERPTAEHVVTGATSSRHCSSSDAHPRPLLIPRQPEGDVIGRNGGWGRSRCGDNLAGPKDASTDITDRV